MAFLIVDEDKCNGDGICVAECPMTLIRFEEGASHPSVVPGGEEACNRCGHCIAACPQGALSHARIPVEDCPEIKPELMINEEQAVQFLRSRRSIRAYKDKPVEREKIKRLIEIACYAPTGGNTQLVEWLVLTDKNKLWDISRRTIEAFRQIITEMPQELAHNSYLPMLVKAWEDGRNPILWSAPVLVVASAPKEASTGMTDLCIALSYLDLLAQTMGLGTCWAGLLQQALAWSTPLKEFLGVPAEHPHFFPVILGYPESKYYRLPKRKPPKITFE
jgi:nitroreductase/NAD-dependent dihydropyrimidine dehydrogenase PreA subunit